MDVAAMTVIVSCRLTKRARGLLFFCVEKLAGEEKSFSTSPVER